MYPSIESIDERSESPPRFKNFRDAESWMLRIVDDPFIDNIRSTFLDSEKGKETYRKRFNAGCCGFFDEIVIINGKRAIIGCNYGH